jgi:hypothetical protein
MWMHQACCHTAANYPLQGGHERNLLLHKHGALVRGDIDVKGAGRQGEVQEGKRLGGDRGAGGGPGAQAEPWGGGGQESEEYVRPGAALLQDLAHKLDTSCSPTDMLKMVAYTASMLWSCKVPWGFPAPGCEVPTPEGVIQHADGARQLHGAAVDGAELAQRLTLDATTRTGHRPGSGDTRPRGKVGGKGVR